MDVPEIRGGYNNSTIIASSFRFVSFFNRDLFYYDASRSSWATRVRAARVCLPLYMPFTRDSFTLCVPSKLTPRRGVNVLSVSKGGASMIFYFIWDEDCCCYAFAFQRMPGCAGGAASAAKPAQHTLLPTQGPRLFCFSAACATTTRKPSTS